jgi:tRNA/rRNA methyltransferase
MANFGLSRLTVVAPFAPSWREARSAVGAPDLLLNAKECPTLSEALANCTLVAGTGTLTYRKPEQPVVALPDLGPRVQAELARGGRVGLVFGPEKHGLTREDLSYCHLLVEIPTDERQPSMNLGQAVAVCLYELTVRGLGTRRNETATKPTVNGERLERLAGVVDEAMHEAGYSPRTMEEANRHDLRLLLRRLELSEADCRRTMGLFRRLVWALRKRSEPE